MALGARPLDRRHGRNRQQQDLEKGLLAIVGAVGSETEPALEDIALGRAPQPLYRDFLDALAVAVYTTDADGRITFFNEAAVAFWGRRPELGELWCGSWRLYWSDGRPMRHDECQLAVSLRENRTVRGDEAIAERPDGTRVYFVPHPTPLRDANGTLMGAVNVLVDVTERRRAEDALRTTAEALRASNAVKDEFLGLVSHELRTPVTTIFGNARLLHERGHRLTAEDKREMVADIAYDSERLLGIIENLLMLTRLESGTQLELEPQVLAQVVRTSIEGYRRRDPLRSIQLSLEPRHIIVEADATFLELVLNNLISNADKYSPAGAEVEVVVRADETEAQVLVLDRGMGIRKADITRVFAPFFRSDAARARASGLGIGLAVCKRVIETQGGRIWALPRAGGGTEMGFALPLALDPEDSAAMDPMSESSAR
jgi:PAS domain S-box-containing protein